MAQCWPLQLPPTAKAVLISLADNANDQGYCWPSISTIAERTCFGRTAVIKAISWLETAGLLEPDRTNGRHTTYVVKPENYREETVQNQSTCRTGPPAVPVREATNRSARRTEPVREADTNRQEPSLRATVKDMDFSAWPDRPSPQVLKDWIDHRKRKKAPISETVMKAAGREITKAFYGGMTVDECLEVWMLRNWQGFKADWALNESKGNANGSGRKLSAVDRVRASAIAGEAADRAISNSRPYLVGSDD